MLCGKDVEAASKKTKALKAYNAFLAKNESNFVVQEFDYQTINNESKSTASSFLVVDLDGNKIPELVTIHDVAYKECYIQFYTYKNGKVVAIRNSKSKKAQIAVFSQAQGYYEVYACKKNHLHVIWQGGWIGNEEKIYQVKSGKLKLYLSKEENDLGDAPVVVYKKNGKKTTGKVYQSLTSKCKKIKKGYFVKNNKNNRRKYLK